MLVRQALPFALRTFRDAALTFIKYIPEVFCMGEGNSAKGHRDGWELKQLPSEESLNDQGWLEKMWLWALKLKEDSGCHEELSPHIGRQAWGQVVHRICP